MGVDNFVLMVVGVLIAMFISKNVYFVDICYLIRPLIIPVSFNQPVTWQTGPAVAKDTPNIVVILLDDLGFNDISFYGGGYHFGNVSTPNIDSIAQKGMSFDNAYAGHATCSPSRAALLTGKYATRIGHEFTPSKKMLSWILGSKMDVGSLKSIVHNDGLNDAYGSDQSLPSSEVTIAEAVQEAGYHTMLIGKWHLGSENHSMPLSQGFDEALSYNLGIRYLGPMDRSAENCPLPDLFDRFQWSMCPHAVQYNHGKRFEIDGYATDYFAEEASKAIRANRNRPFFLYFSPSAIHSPLQARKEDYDRLSHIPNHCDRVYAAMIVAADRAVGRVLETLRNEGLEDDTLVLLSSDNGAPNMVSRPGVNAPFRGWKATFFEGGFRVPLFMQWPGRIAPGSSFSPVVSQVDIFPTIMAVLKKAMTHAVDGVNLLPHLLSGETPADRGEKQSSTLYPGHNDFTPTDICPNCTIHTGGVSHERGLPINSVHPTLFWRSGHYSAIRQGHWKLQRSSNPIKLWMFNLEADPTEQHNLAYSPDHQNKLHHLLRALSDEDAKQVPSLWPSVSQTPFLVDKVWGEKYEEGDEYIYWPN